MEHDVNPFEVDNFGSLEPSNHELHGVSVPDWCKQTTEIEGVIARSNVGTRADLVKVNHVYPFVNWPYAIGVQNEGVSVYYQQISEDEVAVARAISYTHPVGKIHSSITRGVERSRRFWPYSLGSGALFGSSIATSPMILNMAPAFPIGTTIAGMILGVLGVARVARNQEQARAQSQKQSEQGVKIQTANEKFQELSGIIATYHHKLATPYAKISSGKVYIDVAALSDSKDEAVKPFRGFLTEWDQVLSSERFYAPDTISQRLGRHITNLAYKVISEEYPSNEYRKHRLDNYYAVEINPSEIVQNIFSADADSLSNAWDGNDGIGNTLRVLQASQQQLLEAQQAERSLRALNIAGSKNHVPLDKKAKEKAIGDRVQAEQQVVLAVIGLLVAKQMLERQLMDQQDNPTWQNKQF